MLHQLIAITVFLSISITPNLAQPHLCSAYTDTQFLPDDCTSVPLGTGNGEATDAPCCNPVIPGEACVACPTPAPTTPAPTTPAPVTSVPPSRFPSLAPSLAPSLSPTATPSSPPTLAPTLNPTQSPSLTPSQPPSLAPSLAPSNAPTFAPSIDTRMVTEINVLYITIIVLGVSYVLMLCFLFYKLSNNINEPPIVEMQNLEDLNQHDRIPADINGDVLQHTDQISYQNVAPNRNIPLDDVDDNQNVSASSDMYEIMDNQNDETKGRKSMVKHEPHNDNEVHEVEGPVNRGQSDGEYRDIIHVLRECNDVEWKRYLDNFKKHKSNDKRLKQYWSEYSDKEWQKLIPEFGLMYEFKDLWAIKLMNQDHKRTQYID
eukprot:646552_1